MTEFAWTGINISEKKIEGKINAGNKMTARELVEKNDITLLTIKKNNSLFSVRKIQQLSNKQKLNFTQQLQLLLQASIPLTDALSLIKNTSQHKIIQSISHALKEKIIGG